MRANLISFLENLLTRLKKGDLSKEEETNLTDFYMSSIHPSISENNLKKYFFLGWFLYNALENKDCISRSIQ